MITAQQLLTRLGERCSTRAPRKYRMSDDRGMVRVIHGQRDGTKPADYAQALEYAYGSRVPELSRIGAARLSWQTVTDMLNMINGALVTDALRVGFHVDKKKAKTIIEATTEWWESWTQ